MNPKVSIIVLNWNAVEDTIKCVKSFLQLQYSNYEIVVVDNDSTDNSTQRIKEKFPAITLIETGKNLGYTGGNNTGIKYAINNQAEYIMIVNNDTEVINTLVIKEIVDKIGKDPSVGIVGPKILVPGSMVQDTILFTPILTNCIKESIRLRLGNKKSKNYNISQQVESVSGVCWFIRKKVIENIGLLDENYFMYVEEQDYCYRARKDGWKIMYYPIESVIHYKGIEDKNMKRIRRQYVFTRRNIVLFLYKHYGLFQALILAVVFFMSNTLKFTFSKLTKKRTNFYNWSLQSALFHEFKYILNTKVRKRK